MKRDDQYRYILTMETLTVALAIMVDRNIIAISDLDQVADCYWSGSWVVV